jgi:hypothetical protein
MITNPSNLNKIAAAYNTTTTPAKEQKNFAAEELGKTNASNNKANGNVDTIEIGNGSKEAFGTYKIDRQKLNQIKQDFAQNTDSFKEMVRAMLEKQGIKYERVMKAFENGENPLVEIDGDTRAKAKEAISENGYWGVNKTAERLLDFAKTISGGDPSKIETLKAAFKEGFEQAKEAFGGTLPEISQMTYDKVMEGFDAWQNGNA